MTLPPEARAGVMRAWVAILTERHPGVVWVDAGERSTLAGMRHETETPEPEPEPSEPTPGEPEPEPGEPE